MEHLFPKDLYGLFLGLLFVGIFGFFSIASAQNAVLYFVPASSTFAPGQTFRVTVMVDTKGESVNAVAAYFTYSLDKLDALSVDTLGSAMTLIAEPQAGNPVAVNGKVLISGGTPTPGFSGIQKIASVDFRVKASAAGSDILAFTSDAAILRDSDNKNILSLGSSGTATFEIQQLSPPTPLGAPSPPPSPEEQPLLISDIKVTKLGNTEIELSWHTSRPTDARVYYGPSVAEDYPFSVWDDAKSQEHRLTLSDVILSDYVFEIIGVDELGIQVKTERLVLTEFLKEESKFTPVEVVEGEVGIRILGVRIPMLVVFVLLPIVVLLLAGLLLFQRMRARVEG